MLYAGAFPPPESNVPESSDAATRTLRRLPSLDGWRAVAIGIVVLSHFEFARGFPEGLRSWWGRVFQGKLGVRVFFVISGFLITHLLLEEAWRRGRPSLKAFYARRVLRIFPVYFLFAGVLGLLALAGLYSDAPSTWLGTLTFNRDLVGHGDSVTVHFWSLGVEEKFYLGWPVTFTLLCLWKRPRLAAALLLVPLAASPVLRAGWIQEHLQPGLLARILGPSSIALYADGLAMGCLGAVCVREARGRFDRWASSKVLDAALAILVAATVWLELRPGPWTLLVVPSIQNGALMVALWITLVRSEGWLYRLLNLPAVAWLGTLSYSYYVWQQLFLAHFSGPALGSLPVYDWRIWWLTALGVACLSYYGLERPVLRLKDRLRLP